MKNADASLQKVGANNANVHYAINDANNDIRLSTTYKVAHANLKKTRMQT